MGGNNIASVPIVDAVQEFNVMTNMYNAEYGHTGGGIMNVVLKSGTNQHHGTAWEFMRRTPLDANTFQNNASARPTAGARRPTTWISTASRWKARSAFPKMLTQGRPGEAVLHGRV